MTSYAPTALQARAKARAGRDETPLRFRLYAGVYTAFAVLAAAFLALVPVLALA